VIPRSAEQPTSNSPPKRRVQYTIPQTGRRVLRYSGSLNLSKYVMCPRFYHQVLDSAIPHQIIFYLRVSLGKLAVKTPTVGANHPEDQRDHWASLKDLIFKLLRLRKDTRRPADNNFDLARTLGEPTTTTSITRFD
jgi:hypothetical protein